MNESEEAVREKQGFTACLGSATEAPEIYVYVQSSISQDVMESGSSFSVSLMLLKQYKC